MLLLLKMLLVPCPFRNGIRNGLTKTWRWYKGKNDEYQKYFEKDKALERRFQKVFVDEPDTESAISILRGIKEKYEEHHQVQLSDNAIRACVELSDRYISDKYLPLRADLEKNLLKNIFGQMKPY